MKIFPSIFLIIILSWLISVHFAYGQEGRSLLPITQNGKCGYIDKTGKMVIKPQFDYSDGFYEGLARVQIGEKLGFIDENGSIVIQPNFDSVLFFSNGLAPVQIDDKWGYIDNTGNLVINPKFDFAFSFLKVWQK